MVRYFYSSIPVVIVATLALLSLPWLGLIALAVFGLVALGAVAALTMALVAIPAAVVRAIGRGRREHGHVDRPRAALSLAERQNAYVTIGERRSGATR
jgi:hypothetical protein